MAIGACLPTAIAEARENGRLCSADAGQAFFLFSIGAALAACVLPFVFGMTDALYLLPLICGMALLAAAGRPVLFTAGIVFLASCFFLHRGQPLLRGARGVDRGPVRMAILDERSDRVTTASVVHDRVNGERILYTEAFSAAGGESSTYMRALGLLPIMLGPTVGELCVICLGTGTTAGTVARSAGQRTVHLVEISPAVWYLSKYFDESRSAWNAAPGRQIHR